MGKPETIRVLGDDWTVAYTNLDGEKRAADCYLPRTEIRMDERLYGASVPITLYHEVFHAGGEIFGFPVSDKTANLCAFIMHGFIRDNPQWIKEHYNEHT